MFDQELPVAYTTPSGLGVRRLQPAIGAEISGANLSAIPPEVAADLRQVILAHGVIFFRDQPLDYHSHLALARVFGEAVKQNLNSPQPELGVMKSELGTPNGAAGVWHTDGSFMRIPPSMSVVRAVVSAPLGGDTCFASGTAAYAGLPEALKARIAPLRARASIANAMETLPTIHRKKASPEMVARYPEVDHPVVRIHPDTGVPVLYVNSSHTIGIAGMDEAESSELMRELCAQFKRPEYQMRWRWEKDSVAVWDNRAVQHYAVPDQLGFRQIERIEVMGTPTIGILDRRAA